MGPQVTADAPAPAHTTDRDRPFVPVPLAEVDSGEAVGDVRPNADGRVLLRVLDHGWPVTQRIESGLATADDVVRRAGEIVAREGSPRPDGWPPRDETSGTAITVVICTTGEEAGLRTAVDAVLGQTHRAVDLIVVDNRPANGGVDALIGDIADPRLRIVRESRPGLSVARNTGLAHARAGLIAFTDDDAVPHPRWVAELVRVFDIDPVGDVACVTGLVLPAGFATEAQLLFEECSGFSKGFRAMRWSRGGPVGGELAALTVPGVRGVAFPYGGGEFGSGNNMAFRTALLRELGGFDVALGAGTATRGGEDLDIFRRVYLGGFGVVYHPPAVVGHHHRRDLEGLRSQMYGHGTGMAAVATKVVLGGAALPVLRRVPASLAMLLRADSTKNERKSVSFPADVTRAELRGYLAGPFLLLRSRRAARRAGLAAAPRPTDARRNHPGAERAS